MEKNCTQCNKVFKKACTNSQAYFLKQKFCGMKCYGEHKKVHISSSLENLKKAQSPEAVQKMRQTLIRIGHKPSVIFRARGAKNWMWRGGITSENDKFRKSNKYKSWRKSVFERDNYTCQNCGIHGGELHADHIKPFAWFESLRLELSNGRTLCSDCHRKTDSWGKGSYKYRELAMTPNF